MRVPSPGVRALPRRTMLTAMAKRVVPPTIFSGFVYVLQANEHSERARADGPDLLARFFGGVRAPPGRSLPLLPSPLAKPVGRRRPRPGYAGPRLRDPGAERAVSAEPARVAVSRGVEPVDRSSSPATPRG